MPPRRRLAAVPDRPARRDLDLRDAVKAAVDAMTWLTPSDKALSVLVLRLADEIEETTDRAEELLALRRELASDEDALKRLKALEARCDATKIVGWLGPQLQGLLRDLGGTPLARRAMEPEKPIGGRLATLRAGAPGSSR